MPMPRWSTIAWGPTLKLGVARGVSAGVVLGVLILLFHPAPIVARATLAGMGLLVMPLYCFVGFPINYFVFKGVASLIGAFTSEAYGRLVWSFFRFFLTAIVAIGDPIVYLVDRAAPQLFNVADFKPFNFHAVIFILKTPMASAHAAAAA
jgi:hypothetical protein